MKGPNKSELEDIHLPTLQMFTGDLRGSRRFSLQYHRETLYSSKGKIVYVVGKPCNIYRLRGNPMVIIGFSLRPSRH